MGALTLTGSNISNNSNYYSGDINGYTTTGIFFIYLVDTKYPSIKKYIVSKEEHQVVLEDEVGEGIFGSNDDLKALFEWPCYLPISKFSVSYKEKYGYYEIKINLK